MTFNFYVAAFAAGRILPFAFPFQNRPTDHIGRKGFLPVKLQGGLSFLFRLSEPRFA
jgi:hypothetical protein